MTDQSISTTPSADGSGSGSSNAPPVSTATDPYLIHPSDRPTVVFFSPLLQGYNYATWERGISKALNAKGKLGFINGSLLPPTDELQFSCWNRADDLVGSWILNSVHSEIRSSCMYAESAFAIYN
ncbi:hypothetical protein BVC80_1563g11 [Macleaya cordata]|uniref:Retrotransposon Copia-like N-terminal domain-containing protein n=1 Tax=Macleaya cordata TaxID=56857 RepID=A0A200QTQ7_MACCD|nr:hypothetical protein BVC80_1563g11 [Macleaya cordata]